MVSVIGISISTLANVKQGDKNRYINHAKSIKATNAIGNLV